jgi:hypothetical protein
MIVYTRWFKYDRDSLCVNKSQFVPVIFEPPCIYRYISICNIQGGSNMSGTNCDLFTHSQSRSYLNHLVYSVVGIAT